MFISEDIRYIGVNDCQKDMFEGQYAVPQGIAYNSYVILDDKIAVMDTVDADFTKEWLEKLENVLAGRQPDYLIVHHMEPDHSASTAVFLERYPEVTVVASSKAFAMMKNFFSKDYAERRLVVGDGDSLCLGRHMLRFTTAIMVHWPEVIVTYDETDKVLFSADAFGKFGALDETDVCGKDSNLAVEAEKAAEENRAVEDVKEVKGKPIIEEDWATEARRYYIGIVGRYGAQVQALLKKVSAFDIQTICPLHGPVLTDNIGYYVGLYQTWSSYEAEQEGVVIAYTSIYGNTKKAALLLADKLREKGCETAVYDLARCDMAAATADAFRYSKLVLATTTYNADIFPFMKEFINHLTERMFRKRTVGMIENGSWAPLASRVIRSMLQDSKDITFTETTVKIMSALNEESLAQLDSLAEELATLQNS